MSIFFGSSQVRFNPNFYNNGKICLSILHTWAGPRWSASQTLTSLLCSIQSLMTEKPYQNEPGHEKMKGTPFLDAPSLRFKYGTFSSNREDTEDQILTKYVS